jgi:hypothetical protein
VYFYNFDYDSRYIVPQNANHIDTMRTLFIDNMLCVLKFKKSMGDYCTSVEYRDAWKLFAGAGDPSSLDSVSKSFDIEHKKMDPTTQFQKYKTTCQQKDKYKLCQTNPLECPYFGDCKNEYFIKVKIDDPWFREYLKLDCISLYELLKVYQKEIDTIAGEPVKLGYTLASTAMRLYRTMEPGKFALIRRMKSQEEENGCLDMVRKSYTGGRCEVFKRLGSNLHSYDVNSLYPSVMFDFNYPINPSHPFDCTMDEFYNVYRPLPYIISCRVRAPTSLMVPVLAIKDKPPGQPDEKLLYRVGEFEGCWCKPEFEKALELGYEIVSIDKVIIYGSEVDLFSNYVRKLYTIKQTSKGARRAVAKLLMNSLYGKFGQRDEVHRLKITDSEGLEAIANEEDDDGEPRYRVMANKALGPDQFLIEYKGDSFMRHNYVSIAAFVTSQARLRLYQFIEVCNKKGGQVWYVDTDSLKTDVEMPSDPDKLGMLKHEYDLVEGVFIRPKVYAAYKGLKDGVEEVEIKNKGLIKGALKDIHYPTVRGWLFKKQSVLMTYDPKHPERAKHKRLPKSRDILYGVHDMGELVPLKKQQKLVDDKRILDYNLVDTYPIGYMGERVDQLGRSLKGSRRPRNKEATT